MQGADRLYASMQLTTAMKDGGYALSILVFTKALPPSAFQCLPQSPVKHVAGSLNGEGGAATQENTSIPVPEVVEDWEENDHAFIVSRRVPGKTLHEPWATLSDEQKKTIAREVAEYLAQLRRLQSDRMEAVGGRPIYCDLLILRAEGDRRSNVPHGPLSSDVELWAEMEGSLKGPPEAARMRLRSRMPPAEPYTFTHCDLTDVNIMVENGHLTGIIDWEMSGYFPVWWEYACTSIVDSEEDSEWKALLRPYMPNYEQAREFWRDYYYLSIWPQSDRAKAFLEETEKEGVDGGISSC
ncbi:hypothetical protein FE257_001753 [Aspergillus nanangensis]|uniref:Aminoglycoside phosphotransferase domain-containing protein n=1 Tax=Aspergillus nanangensis TaxID=2582783 RepID=A0AAD4CDR9_ASPNN|nr:hypothetical protein FE257_001753 [Aspergillus nanangensis]